MRKRHLIPLTFVVLIGLFLSFATGIVNRGEGNEGSGFVQIESRLVNGALLSSCVSHKCIDNGEYSASQNSDFPVIYHNAGDQLMSCDSSLSRWISDTMIIADVIRAHGPDADPELSTLKFDYVASTSNGPLILAQNEMVGIYLIQKPGCDEMVFMNYFDRAVQVDFQEAKHKGMPDIITTNYDMSLSFYVWDGSAYILDHEGKWDCPA